jgi:Protein of unknown function (DUF1616)
MTWGHGEMRAKFNPADQSVLDLVISAALAVAALVLGLLAVSVPVISLVLGLLLALFLPGYALVAALFPDLELGRDDKRTPVAVRIMFSIGSSLALSVLIGFVLNFTPFGLSQRGFSIGLGTLTFALLAVALSRRRALPQVVSARSPDSEDEPLWNRVSANALVRGGVLGLAGIIAAGAVLFSYLEAQRIQTPDVLQLWALPSADSQTVEIGLRNLNNTRTDFRLAILRDGYAIAEWTEIRVQPGETWQVLWTPDTSAPGDGPFEALLYPRGDNRQPIRRVQVWTRP